MSEKNKDVRPITNEKDCKMMLKYLKNAHQLGIRDYVIFKLGMSCVLRVSDLIHLRYDDVYTPTGQVKKKLIINEIKTGKRKEMPLVHVANDLIEYKRVLDAFIDNQPATYMKPLSSKEKETVGRGKNAREILKNDKWLFPSTQHPTQHISINTFYKSITNAKNALGFERIGTHTPRKTGAYLYYRGGFDDVLEEKGMQPRNDIALAMTVLNHSSEKSTLHYLGLEQENLDRMISENSAFDINI